MSNQNINSQVQIIALLESVNDRIQCLKDMWAILVTFQNMFSPGLPVTEEDWQKFRSMTAEAGQCGEGFCEEWVNLNNAYLEKLKTEAVDIRGIH